VHAGMSKLPIAAALVLIPLAGCQSLPNDVLYACPHPWDEVKQAEQFVTLVLDLPQDLLTAPPTVDNPFGGPCPRPQISGYTAACVNVETGIIWRDDSLLTFDSMNVYRHEVCHLYEGRVLGLAASDHEGWIVNPTKIN
jgi:hypothetical protein